MLFELVVNGKQMVSILNIRVSSVPGVSAVHNI